MGAAINWARSTLETRDVATPCKHIQAVVDAKVPLGLMFSGCTPDPDSNYGPWKDCHMPHAPAEGVEFAVETSLMTAPLIKEASQLAAKGQLAFCGCKITSLASGYRPALTCTPPPRRSLSLSLSHTHNAPTIPSHSPSPSALPRAAAAAPCGQRGCARSCCSERGCVFMCVCVCVCVYVEGGVQGCECRSPARLTFATLEHVVWSPAQLTGNVRWGRTTIPTRYWVGSDDDDTPLRVGLNASLLQLIKAGQPDA